MERTGALLQYGVELHFDLMVFGRLVLPRGCLFACPATLYSNTEDLVSIGLDPPRESTGSVSMDGLVLAVGEFLGLLLGRLEPRANAVGIALLRGSHIVPFQQGLLRFGVEVGFAGLARALGQVEEDEDGDDEENGVESRATLGWHDGCLWPVV